MNAIQFFRNTAGNMRRSDIASDTGTHPNGNLLFSHGRPVVGMLGKNLIAVDPKAGLRIPPYMKRIHLVHTPLQ